jgi:PAS domain S-box-containing protein
MSKKESVHISPPVSIPALDILSRIRDAFFALDNRLCFVYINEAASIYFNRDSEELTGKSFEEVFPNKINNIFYKSYRQAMEKQEPVYAEDYMPIQNKWYEKKIYPSASGVTVFIRDITERKLSEQREKAVSEKLNEQDAKFLKTFHDNSIALSLRDLTTHEIIDANEAMLELLGISKSEFIGKKLIQIPLVIDGKKDQAYYNNFLSEKNIHKAEKTNETVAGKKIHVLVNRSTLDLEGREVALTSFVDLTNIRETEKKLRQSNKIAADFKYALDQSAIVTITDHLGNITYANDNFCKISQFSREELIGQNHRIVNTGYHEKSFFADLWNNLSKGEIMSKAKNGTFYWTDTTIIPFLDDKNNPIQYIAIRYDITEKKKAEEKLLDQFQKMKQIAWIQSHLVRAPLARIMGLSELIRKSICTKEEEREILNGIVASSEELDKQIKTIVQKAHNIEGIEKNNLHENDHRSAYQ